MADDKRDGDDLFEDLDKFFAPIKDVDWDEPASAGARETPSEEHVAVRASEPGPGPEPQPRSEPEPEAAPEAARPVPAEPQPPAAATPPADPGAGDDDDDDDEDWYDTSVLDTIDEIGAEAPLGGTGEPAGAGWVEDEPFVSDQVVGDLETETAPMATLDDIVDVEAGVDVDAEEEIVVSAGPSDEDLEAAADHFAPSVREETEAEAGEFPAGLEDDDDIGVLVPAEEAGDAAAAGLLDLEADEQPQTVTVASTEGLGGPSWQESAAVEVGADPERRGPAPGERDVPAAFLTGVVLVGVALASLLIGKGIFGVIAGAVVLLAQGELFGVMVKHQRQPATAVGLVAGALMLAGGYFEGEGAVLAMFALGVVATFLWFIVAPASSRKDTAANVGLTVLNLAWVPLLAGYLLVMLNEPNGTQLVVAVIALTFVYDTAAFLAGSVWGGQFFQRPLAPTVSPKKSVEGLAIGGLVTVIVSVALVSQLVDPLQDRTIEALLLGLVVAAAATFGDLAESLIKRDIGIKDMSSLLPGHGGVLDRIDSLLFVAPATFLLFRIILG